jgi:hypothetical protein
VNGDGLSDVILGTTTGGKAYVVFGKEKGYGSGTVDVTAMKVREDGFVVDVEASVPVPVAGLDVSADKHTHCRHIPTYIHRHTVHIGTYPYACIDTRCLCL